MRVRKEERKEENLERKVEVEESLETCQVTTGEGHYLKVDISWLVWHKGVKRDQ